MPRNNTPVPANGGGHLAKREAVVAQFVQLVNQVPDAPEGDITDLLGPILAAQDWEDLNMADALPSSKTLVGHEIRVDSIAKKVSDKESITGYYLLCDGIDFTTGETDLRFTAGGAQAVAVLSQLYVLRSLPAKVRFDAVDAGAGNTAINCKVLDTYPGATIDG